jgi:hypothetical protein
VRHSLLDAQGRLEGASRVQNFSAIDPNTRSVRRCASAVPAYAPARCGFTVRIVAELLSELSRIEAGAAARAFDSHTRARVHAIRSTIGAAAHVHIDVALHIAHPEAVSPVSSCRIISRFPVAPAGRGCHASLAMVGVQPTAWGASAASFALGSATLARRPWHCRVPNSAQHTCARRYLQPRTRTRVHSHACTHTNGRTCTGRTRMDARAWAHTHGRTRMGAHAWTHAHAYAYMDAHAWARAHACAYMDAHAWTDAQLPTCLRALDTGGACGACTATSHAHTALTRITAHTQAHSLLFTNSLAHSLTYSRSHSE